jgi:hypothetical protein
MANKQSEDYKQGLKDGIKMTCDNLIDMSNRFRRDMLDIMKLMETQK